MIKILGTKRPQRPAAALAAVLMLGLAGGLSANAQPAQTAVPSSAERQVAPGTFAFAQEVSDLKADPAIRFGVLPNGMRYAIRHSATPPGQAALRLRIAAGSLMEDEDQRGLAHFLEHLAFKGSNTVADGEMVKILERLGMAFGADTNASTSYDETIYRLDLPKTDDETVDTSLGLLRDAASELTLATSAIEAERGVVLAEERARDTPAYHLFEQRFAFLLKGQRPPLRPPIGQVEVIRNLTRERVAEFYQAYYRPERALLVAAGDFDVDKMEAKIKARFGDWKATAPDGPEPDLGPVAPRGLEAKVAVQPGAPTSILIAWMSPPDKSLDSVATRRRYLVRGLGLAVLNRRFAALVRGANPPFISAGASRGDQVHAADMASLSATVQPGQWRPAITALETERRRLAAFGVRQDELDREIAEYRAAYEAAAAGAATRRTTAVAADILGAVSENDVATSPQEELALFNAVVETLRAEEVSAVVRDVFTGQGPLIFVATPTAIEGGEPAVLETYTAAQKIEVTPPAAPVAGVWPYTQFGEAGKVASRTEVSDLDTVFVTFENGVRLTVKPTRFRDEQIEISVRFGHGVASMPSDRQNPSWAGSAFVEGGLAKLTVSEMEGVLASKNYNVSLSLDDTAFELNGATRPDDLEVQMQALAAYATEPGWRIEAFDRIRSYGATLHDQLEATSGGVVRRDLSALMRGGDRRWTFPTREEIANSRLDELRAVIDPALRDGAIEVVIVGDTTVEKAIDAVAMTFGALPKRPALTAAAPQALRFPAPNATPVVLTHKGRADQALGYIAWPTDDFHSDPRRARAGALLSDIVKLRLVQEFREKQAVTYSPSVGYSASQIWPGYGYLAATIEAPPAALDGFFAEVQRIAADLAATPVTADELNRAKAPTIEGLLRSRQTNDYWLGQLAGAQTDQRRLDAVRSSIAGYEAITAADIQAVAKTYLREDRAWKLVVRAEGS